MRAHRRSDGKLSGQAISDATTGAYSITTLDTSPHTIQRLFGTVTDNGEVVDHVTSLLLGQGANNSTAIVDATGRTITRAGDTKIVTSVADPFGVSDGVIYFDGNGDYLDIGTEALGSLFAIEFWWYPLSPDRQALVAYSADFSVGLDYGCNGVRNVSVWASSTGGGWNLINADGGGNGIGTISLTLNAWNHIALSVSGGVFTTRINGTQDKSVSAAGSIYTAGRSLRIGVWGNGAYPAYGYLSNFRLVNGAVTGAAVPTVAFAYPRYAIGIPDEPAQITDYVIPA